MLFHFDEIIPNVTDQKKSEFEPSGCSTIYVKNNEHHVLGHTEDAAADCMNNFYIVSAHVVSEKTFGRFQVKEEKFTSLCYPGHIGGYTMNFNKHGLVFTINTLVAQKLLARKIREFFSHLKIKLPEMKKYKKSSPKASLRGKNQQEKVNSNVLS